jgi:hypothetical protein
VPVPWRSLDELRTALLGAAPGTDRAKRLVESGANP